MSNHTKEPWLCDKRTVYALNKKGFNIFSAVVQDCRTSNSELEENARRIVACVNACEGISTENLEDNLPVKELARQYNEAIRQRDLLLEALDRIVWGRKLGEKPSKHVEAMERIAINAIACAKGGAA